MCNYNNNLCRVVFLFFSVQYCFPNMVVEFYISCLFRACNFGLRERTNILFLTIYSLTKGWKKFFFFWWYWIVCARFWYCPVFNYIVLKWVGMSHLIYSEGLGPKIHKIDISHAIKLRSAKSGEAIISFHSQWLATIELNTFKRSFQQFPGTMESNLLIPHESAACSFELNRGITTVINCKGCYKLHLFVPRRLDRPKDKYF